MSPSATLFALASGPDDMKALGAALAGLLQPGDTVLLGGDLGAGKTTFVQGLAAALGVGEPVTSPTFVLVHSYQTAAGWALLHADVWRLEQLQEVIDLALPELIEDGGAVVVEWGEMAAPALAADCLTWPSTSPTTGRRPPARRANRAPRAMRSAVRAVPVAWPLRLSGRAGSSGWPGSRRRWRLRRMSPRRGRAQ
ncbi:MAG: tRNA (adenosine(37)-N6)-threonylcarbamoyltransferase complex ATPase subunit type 1 TsaE [Acidimicrobiales bacterium]